VKTVLLTKLCEAGTKRPAVRVSERHVNAVERHDRDARSVDRLLAI
jgi:hypothetical protein